MKTHSKFISYIKFRKSVSESILNANRWALTTEKLIKLKIKNTFNHDVKSTKCSDFYLFFQNKTKQIYSKFPSLFVKFLCHIEITL